MLRSPALLLFLVGCGPGAEGVYEGDLSLTVYSRTASVDGPGEAHGSRHATFNVQLSKDGAVHMTEVGGSCVIDATETRPKSGPPWSPRYFPHVGHLTCAVTTDKRGLVTASGTARDLGTVYLSSQGVTVDVADPWDPKEFRAVKFAGKKK